MKQNENGLEFDVEKDENFNADDGKQISMLFWDCFTDFRCGC